MDRAGTIPMKSLRRVRLQAVCERIRSHQNRPRLRTTHRPSISIEIPLPGLNLALRNSVQELMSAASVRVEAARSYLDVEG